MARIVKPKWDARQTAAENARRVLPEMAVDFFATGREVAQHQAPLKELHRFRLVVKRFRYSLELFRSCYGPALKDRLTALKRLQDYLGDLNDCDATRGLLGASVSLQDLPERRPLESFLENKIERLRHEFIDYWTKEFDAPGQMHWWQEGLKGIAGETGETS